MARSSLRLTINLALLLLLCGTSMAQTDQRVYDLQNVIPPSPNAASIAKYTNWPVNLYTGLPQINIPIYELKGRSTSVSMSLSYHASGIKVGEYASSVGLGWSLQAGGCITRSVRGLPDDESGAGYMSLRSSYNNPGDLSSGTSPATTDSLDQLSIINGNADSEPDLYMINAMGKSYKFYFSGNGTIITQPYSNLKITSNTADSSWTVITEDGTKLKFGGGTKFVEQTASSNFDPLTYISSWFLKSITTVSGEVINFTYTVSYLSQESYYYQTDYLYDHVAVNNLTTGQPVTSKVALAKLQSQSVYILNLATIESDLGRIVIDTSTRVDLIGATAITGIRIFSKLTNSYIKSYKLYYTYSTAVNSNVYSSGPSAPPYRLRLDSLEEIPIDNTPHKYWQFSYNPTTLPSRKSFAQDYWGYYNGAVANTTMLPFCIAFNPDQYPYANRSADSSSMLAEMLTQVTYPTGGYSQFNYEPNSYPANEEQFAKTQASLHLYLTYNQPGFTNTQTTTFTTTKPQYFNFQFKGIFSVPYMNDYGTGTIIASALLKNSSGTTISFINLDKASTGINYTAASVLLNPGTYTFTISSISVQADFYSSAYNADLSASYTYQTSLGIKPVNHSVGGVRVKSIFFYDNVDNSKSTSKYYQYENPYIISPLDTTVDFVTSITDNLYDCGGNITACGSTDCLATSVLYNARSSSTKFSLGTVQGGQAAYGKVTEKFGPNAENGKNVYYYSYATDFNIASSKVLPFPKIISLDYERGLLLEEDNYTTGNLLISKSQNTYQFIRRAGAVNMYAVALRFNILSSCYSYNFLAQSLTRIFYGDFSEQVQHASSTQVAYNTTTGDSLTSTTNYYYDDTLNMQPTRTVTFNSRGDSVLTYSRTALEKTDINNSIALTATASLSIDSMKARNMVELPVESEKYTKSVLTGKALTNYKLQSNGIVQPDNVQVQNANNALETRVYFPRYNVKGNLLEQMKAGDEKHDYIWDYQYTYPVAEVVNADSNSIAYTSFEADGTGNWTISSTARDSLTPAITGYKSYNLINGGISTSIALTSTKTYIVSYWSKSGSYTVTSGGTPKQGKTVSVNATAWTYYEHTITGVTGITITGTNNIDELRLYPLGAQMTTYTYLPMIGITSQCDLNNRITYYQYDGYQQLYLVMDQDRNTLKKFCYNYSGQAIACSQFYNVAKSGVFIDSCAANYSGSSVTYNVPANKYASLTSQAAADLLAQNDVNTNGQAYANTHGTCTVISYTITASNINGLSGFRATYTNTSTSVQTVFTIPVAGGNIGTLAAGTYNVTIAQTGNTTIKYLYTVCNTSLASSITGVFSNIVISSTCNTLGIDTVN